jgi:Zn-dependent peptidase ImmA (M78 family)
MSTSASRSRSKIQSKRPSRVQLSARRRRLARNRREIQFATTAPLMRDLYKRLHQIGFDQNFVRSHVLPDWWDDSLGSIPSNRAIAEATISRVLAVPVTQLRDPAAKLTLPPVSEFRLKRNKGTKAEDLLPAVHVAFQSARAILDVATDVPVFCGQMTAAEVRAKILRNRAFVDLHGLIDFAWSSGIVVIHLAALPKGSKKFSGIAAFCTSRPAIILATSRDSAPWIAFHLAHEVAHLMLGHVTPDSGPLIDSDIETVDNSEQEVAADEFACEILTALRKPSAGAVYGLTAEKLARRATHFAVAQHIDPGMFVLVYGRSAARMPVAQNALKLLGLDRGGHRILNEALRRHLPSEIPETTERLLGVTAP